MTPEVWRRHANPWSVYTRIPGLLLLTAALWSRAWIGWWCLLPTGIVLLWIYVNPRAFPPPRAMDSWAARATLGEQIWLRRKESPIPHGHARAARRLTALAGAGLPLLAWGVWTLSPWPALVGLVVVYAGKLWFLDRMVWLYLDTTDNPQPTTPNQPPASLPPPS